MIPVDGLISLFQRMYREHWPYVWGKAETGCVDCSGAFVWAYAQYHLSIPHGSNAIARQSVRELLPISQAKPGMAAFKYYPPGHPKWNLPQKYRKGGSAYNGDLNDYYHVGLVDDGSAYVLNAQGTQAGFTRTKLKSWGAVGYLKAVDYKEEVKPMETYIVTAENGFPVKVRAKANKESLVITSLDVGTEVQAEEPDGGWQRIYYGQGIQNGGMGYMMSKFLRKAGETPAVPDGIITITMAQYNDLCEARDKIEAALATIKTVVGVG